jgi:hypothetical protein
MSAPLAVRGTSRAATAGAAEIPGSSLIDRTSANFM